MILVTTAGKVGSETSRLLGKQGVPVRVDVRNVAAVAAQIAASPSAHAGKTYWPTGPEVLSGTEVAAVFSKVLGRTITFHPISFEEQRQAMLNVGLPEAVAEDNATAVSMM